MLTVDQTNTVLVKASPLEQNTPFDQNDFIQLFLDDGPFNYLKEFVYGISTHNFLLKIFSVTFAPTTNATVIRNFVHKFSEPTSFLTSSGITLCVSAKYPPRPLLMVTLYPMPFTVTFEQLQTLTRGWGSLEKYDFGRHKIFPAFRNPYLHLHFKNPIRDNIPDTVRVNNRYVTVMVQGEENLRRCGYCKAKDHVTAVCPKKPSPKLQQTSSKPSYASVTNGQPTPSPEVSPFTTNPLGADNTSPSTQAESETKEVSQSDQHQATDDESPKEPPLEAPKTVPNTDPSTSGSGNGDTEPMEEVPCGSGSLFSHSPTPSKPPDLESLFEIPDSDPVDDSPLSELFKPHQSDNVNSSSDDTLSPEMDWKTHTNNNKRKYRSSSSSPSRTNSGPKSRGKKKT